MAITLASIHLFGVRFQVKTNLKCVSALFLFSKYTLFLHRISPSTTRNPSVFFFQSIKINLNESVFTTWFLLLSVSLISQLDCRLNVNWICFHWSRLIVGLRYWWFIYIYLPVCSALPVDWSCIISISNWFQVSAKILAVH